VLTAKGSPFEPLSTMSITIASLILGKAVLVVDMLPPINRDSNKPVASVKRIDTTLGNMIASAAQPK
jgi:hypothetical protein